MDGRNERDRTVEWDIEVRGEEEIDPGLLDLQRELHLLGQRIMFGFRNSQFAIRNRAVRNPVMISRTHEQYVANIVFPPEQMRDDFARVAAETGIRVGKAAIDANCENLW